MDLRKIKKLIELIDETGVAEIEIKEGEESVRISRNGIMPPMYHAQPMPQPMAPQPASAPANANIHAKDEQALQGHVVRSPMVGTMYVSNAPRGGTVC